MGELDRTGAATMTFDLRRDPDGTDVVRIAGELDMSNVEELEAAVAPLLEKGPQRLVVDVRALRFADSSAIALWVKWANRVSELELRDPPLLMRRVISSMGLAERFHVAP